MKRCFVVGFFRGILTICNSILDRVPPRVPYLVLVYEQSPLCLFTYMCFCCDLNRILMNFGRHTFTRVNATSTADAADDEYDDDDDDDDDDERDVHRARDDRSPRRREENADD